MRISDWSSDVCSSDLGLFASALLTARTRDAAKGAEAMKVYRTRVAGHLAFAESVGRPRTEVTQDVGDRPERIFDGPVRHVALMRPSELVVRSVEFPGMREESDWAGEIGRASCRERGCQDG